MAIPDPTYYYKLDGDATDEMGVSDGTNFTTSTATGIIGDCFYFDGVNDYVNTNWSSITLPITVNMWVYPDTGGTEEHFFASNDSGANSGFNFRRNASSTLEIYLRGDGGTGQQPTGSGTVSTGAWSMITVVVTSTDTTFYINGTADSGGSVSKTWTGTMNLDGNLFIGARNISGSPNSPFEGYIDEVGVWNGTALTSGEVSELWNGGAGLSYPFTASTPVFNALSFGVNF